MLEAIQADSMETLISETVPQSILRTQDLELPEALSEPEVIEHLRSIADLNQLHRSHIGMGYYDCITPAVIQRNVLENPGWYTQYTPYQAEIAQGRLEALLNFQTMVAELTGLPMTNSSLLDEGTAAAEAMAIAMPQLAARNDSSLRNDVTRKPSKSQDSSRAHRHRGGHRVTQ